MGADAVLASLPWKEAWDIERSFGPASPSDKDLAVARRRRRRRDRHAVPRIGQGQSDHARFSPRDAYGPHLGRDIVGSYEEAWDRLRSLYGSGALPRSVNLIGGPSRTADIEQTIVRGAHGPRRLHVLILG